MPSIYNIEAFQYDLIFIKGDTLPMSLDIFKNDVAYVMTGMAVKMQFKRLDGLLVKTLTSAGGTITILLNNLTLLHAGFNEEVVLQYDIQVTDLSGYILTVGRGKAFIVKEITV